MNIHTNGRVKNLKRGAACSLRHSAQCSLSGVKTLLLMLLMLLTTGVGEVWGQEEKVIVFRNASILKNKSLDYSLAWYSNNDDGARVVLTDGTYADTKQQWILEDAGDGYFYLKNVYSETYLGRTGANNWTCKFFTLEERDALTNNNAKFQITNRLPDGTFTIKTSNNLLSPNETLNYDGTVYADKTETNAHAQWQGVPTPVISYSSGNFTITCSDSEADIYYTTDGSDPEKSDTRVKYTTSFSGEGVDVVRAIAEREYYLSSLVSELYSPNSRVLIQHQLNTDFYMVPGQLDNGNTRVNTTSLMQPMMEWNLQPVEVDGSVYYYFYNVATETYLYCNSGSDPYLKTKTDFGDGSADEYKFSLLMQGDGCYRIVSKARSTHWFSKGNANEPNAIGMANNNPTQDQNHWKIIPMSAKPVETPPFTLSTATDVSYYKLQSAGAQTYYVIPPTGTTGNAQYANTAEGDAGNTKWYFIDAGTDGWHRYYYIVSAATGEYLYYNATISGDNQTNAFITKAISESTAENSDRYQFAIARTTQSSDNGYYYVIPKAIQYENTRNYYNLLWRDNANPLKTTLNRNQLNTKWIFLTSSFICDTPEFSYDAVQGTLTLTSPNNAPMYYVGWNDGDPEPTLSTPSDGTLYSGPFFASYQYYKAIAKRRSDGADKSSEATHGPVASFKTVNPVITYDALSKTVTITTATESAVIYYTINQEINADAPLSTSGIVGPSSGNTVTFTLNDPVPVRAIALRPGVESTMSAVVLWDEAPHYISRASEIGANLSLNYVANEGFEADVTIGTEENPFTGTFDGTYRGISLSQPLFGYTYGATIKNVRVTTLGSDLSGTNVGAIVSEAKGDTKIYNCGVLDNTHTISGSTAAGGIVGHIAAGSSVKVVNCYNYATVSGGTYSGGIVGWNESTVADGTRIAMSMMYGDMTSGTNRSPVYYGGHTSNSQDYTEYNYYRSRANLTYTAYNDQLAIDKDEYLTRFPFYRHILNTHRELAAFFLFHDSKKSSVSTAMAPTAAEVDEIGHWVLNTDIAPYPIIESWEKNTKKTTEEINANLPATTAKGKGKLLSGIGNDGYYTGNGDKVTEMGSGGYLSVSVSINGSSYTVSLPITDMNEDKYDYTWGKVVLPFANEFSGWTRDYSKICTGWKITSISGGTPGTLKNYNFADRDCTAKDLYANSNYIFAQGGNYIVPYGVTAISIEANFANAFYLSDAQADFGYNDTYGGQTNLGWTVPTTYHGETVYTNLNTLMGAMSTSTDPHSQAIVLVGNYHYNQNVINGQRVFNSYTEKALTIMSVDEDNNQEPDYGWYAFQNQNTGRTPVPHIRFDFLPNIGIGMAARVNNSTPNPTIGIWQCTGSFELTETCVSYMSECEIEGNTGSISTADNGKGNNRYIVNSGYFIQIVRAQQRDVNNLSYIKVGGNAFIEQLYPGCHSNSAQSVKLVPIIVTGGEIEECYMTGYRAGGKAWGTDIRFWCAGGKIGKFLGAYLETPYQTTSNLGNVNMTAKVDHALITRFFGGGTSSSARITGNIDITMNNSFVDFYCGGPEFGDMTSGKTVTTNALGTTFGEYYGAGFGGTSITKVRGANAENDTDGQQEVTFSANTTYPIAFSNYHRLENKSGYGIGVNYDFEFIQYAGGLDGKGVARFYTGYASFSLATTGSVTNTLRNCTILKDFYGAGCQGKVSGTVNSTLTDCIVNGSAYGGGYKATANTLEVYPTTQPTYSVYTKETGLFSDFGTVAPETWTWVAGSGDADDTEKTLPTGMTQDVMNTLGNVTDAITLTIEGNSVIGTDGDTTTGNVFGGGNESHSLNNTTVTLKGNTQVLGNVFGGGNKAVVDGNTTVNIPNENAQQTP